MTATDTEKKHIEKVHSLVKKVLRLKLLKEDKNSVQGLDLHEETSAATKRAQEARIMLMNSK